MVPQDRDSGLRHVRPKIHFTDNYWINDPCAPGYDEVAKTYHLFYQMNPFGAQWGNMSWGHLESKDMVCWTKASDQPVMKPDCPYDCKGVFTGCWLPPSPTSKNQELRVVYSSVKQLPFHWSTPPYPKNAAGLAMATSRDAGRTWQKHSRNPVLEGEPEDLLVSGFRDPFVAHWPRMDERLGHEGRQSLYGLVSGGIQGRGPTSFLYRIHDGVNPRWEYLWPLIDPSLRYSLSAKWSGNFGVNWECVNFMTLSHAVYQRDVLIIGAEGDVERDHIRQHERPAKIPGRTVRSQLWMFGDLRQEDESVHMVPRCSGYLDHGSYYAANSFFDTRSCSRVVYGWIPEEDISTDFVESKGWNGSLALPRELFLLQVKSVVGTTHSTLDDITCFEMCKEADGSTSLLTMGVRPIRALQALRDNCGRQEFIASAINLPAEENESPIRLVQATSSTWEFETIVSVGEGCRSFGLYIRHDPAYSQYTLITLSITDEQIVVDTSHSTSDERVAKCPEAGPFTLFTTSAAYMDTNSCSWPQHSREKLHLRIFSDGDILEVFANDRFALASMVYTGLYSRDRGGISVVCSGEPGSAIVEEGRLWDGLSFASTKSGHLHGD